MKHFLSRDNALTAKEHVLKLLRTEGYKTECLEITIIKDRQGFFIEALSETDPQMVNRFRHLFREYIRTLRSRITVQVDEG
ncbi:hypothetical protein A3K01_02685 [candidate division WWE3 bacterium RIFOXYD1_FULL_43_17]|uniref:Uncharacterized protein n=3 Tax=Katanobacteria TaxID=422282 RepID=A0A1F4XEY5_UNCKA|nr:MAG: hypothetical protein UU59_C0006G0012 [candidate division WWE3 bacterium GW2011_GWE1_41_27]KKS60875.1 MAG: hypothetical protein UV26_C0001G0027 [candidate division WWE3 bacterium GW2011_GWF2_42_42]OGC80184.1 MAG: hypothetical protein A3K01_02685 [candidate division WWE3 bacterium RIFOXYD1_FULL_43_17]